LTLRSFGHPEIGFVFSNRAPQNVLVSDFELGASDFRPKAGDWLCFFKLTTYEEL
jgi:hypothetical protein